MKSFDDDIIALAAPYVDKPEMIPNYLTPSNVLDWFYRILVKNGEIVRMEDLSKEEKLRFWNKAKQTGFEETERLIKVARSYYVIEKING